MVDIQEVPVDYVEECLEDEESEADDIDDVDMNPSGSGIDVSLDHDRGVVKFPLASNRNNALPVIGSVPHHLSDVTIHYEGRIADSGVVFDSSYESGDPVTFRVGAGHVIPGLEMAVRTMRAGERARIRIQPQYAYSSSSPKTTASVDIVDKELEFLVEIVNIGVPEYECTSSRALTVMNTVHFFPK